MANYVGYGFHVENVKPEDWLRLLKRDGQTFDSFVEDTKENFGTDDVDSALLQDVENYIDDVMGGLDLYLADVINEGEAKEAGTESVVSNFDGYVFFSPIRFLGHKGSEEDLRAKHVRSEEDFVKMVGKYIDVDSLQIGPIYDGSEYLDPNYWVWLDDGSSSR